MARLRVTSTSTLAMIPRSEPSDSTESSSERFHQVGPGLTCAWRYAPAVTAGEMLPDIAVCRELASGLRAGDGSAAEGLAERAGIPPWLLTHPRLGPRGRLDAGDTGEALGCIS